MNFKKKRDSWLKQRKRKTHRGLKISSRMNKNSRMYSKKKKRNIKRELLKEKRTSRKN